MRVVLPRYIMGNRGDLASRWGVLQSLYDLGQRDVTVFRRAPEDVPGLPFQYLDYGSYRNLILNSEGRRALQEARVVLWAVGLDLQDDSSLAKLLYLWLMFKLYRLRGLHIWSLFQGAGPITTPLGRFITRQILTQLDGFVARDPGTYELVGRICPGLKRVLAHDAIFLPGFEEAAGALNPEEQARLGQLFETGGRPVIGLNIRQWFHFSSSLLPYQFARRKYLKRSQEQMDRLIDAGQDLARLLRKNLDARILLISAYQPGIVPWEDDLPWLGRIQAGFEGDPDVVLTSLGMSLPAYYAMMSRLSLMIGTRLHSTLIAVRYGVPSINVSYTLKGGAILSHLGMPENVIDLRSFLDSPEAVCKRASALMNNLPAEREKTRAAVQHAVAINRQALSTLLSTGNDS